MRCSTIPSHTRPAARKPLAPPTSTTHTAAVTGPATVPVRGGHRPQTPFLARVGRRRPKFVAALLLTALAGCGGAAGAGAGHARTAATTSHLDQAFIGKVDRWCAITVQRYQTVQGTFPLPSFDPLHPDPAQLPQVGRFFARGATVRDRIPAQLQALGEPATGAAAWNGLRDDLIQSTDLADTQITAASAANAPAFAAAAAQVRDLSDKIHATGLQLGFPTDTSCADLF
jgi:hypothetical protein